jgi:hypothetical protein
MIPGFVHDPHDPSHASGIICMKTKKELHFHVTPLLFRAPEVGLEPTTL